MDQFLMNARYALRRLLKAPFFTMVAILSMALGIGANTAVISLANAVLIRDMPYEEVGELVDLYTGTSGFAYSPSSYPDYVDLRDGTRLLRSAYDEVFSDEAVCQEQALVTTTPKI